MYSEANVSVELLLIEYISPLLRGVSVTLAGESIFVGGFGCPVPLVKSWDLGDTAERSESVGFPICSDENGPGALSRSSGPCGNVKPAKEFRYCFIIVGGMSSLSGPINCFGRGTDCGSIRFSANDEEDLRRGDGTVKARSCPGADWMVSCA